MGIIYFAHFPVPFKISSLAPNCPSNFASSMLLLLLLLIYSPANPICPVLSIGYHWSAATTPKSLFITYLSFAKRPISLFCKIGCFKF